jgi:V8-like Glu-specific endopeptidase
MRTSLTLMLTVGFLGGVGVEQSMAQVGQVRQQAGVTALTTPNAEAAAAGATIDYINAKPMEMPRNASRSANDFQIDLLQGLASAPSIGAHVAGAEGNGRMSFVKLGEPALSTDAADQPTPQEFGTNNHPFSTAMADLSPLATNTSYPYRASGKLFFNIGTSTYVCSASLIKRGVVVTAAHCAANFGQKQFYTNWRFVPGYRNGAAPYNTWTVRTAYVLTSYYQGTDSCAVSGVVCANDVAILLLNPISSAYPGTSTGWYGYGYNGYGFSGGVNSITQIGYPVCLDNGGYMERNDSSGVVSAANSNNTVIGSLMCGGSSGGPWLSNFGIRPTIPGTTNGTAPDPNIVVGVTSWGYTSNAPKEQGASPFTSGNIVVLVNTACGAVPGACS